MKKIIIAIHGLGNKPEEAFLRESWLKAIHEGLARVGKPRRNIPFEMVYWADISNPKPLDPNVTDPSDPLFLNEPYTTSPASAPATKPRRLYMRALKFIEDHLDRLFLKNDLSETFPDASSKMIAHYFSELNTYYTHECHSLRNEDCSAKAAIQARLRQTLQNYSSYKILLLSHSMGSIIAFDVLWNPPVAVKINTFVTIGSPLGLPPVVVRNFKAQKAALPQLRQPHAPDCIGAHWYNLSDLRDTVALDHTLRDDYAANQQGLRPVDLLVTNNYQINGRTNPHKSFGYLRTSEVAGIIDSFLSGNGKGFLRRTYNQITNTLTRHFSRNSVEKKGPLC